MSVGEGWCGWFYAPFAVTNSMHLQSTYTPHLQYLQSEAYLESSQTLWWSFFAEIVNV